MVKRRRKRKTGKDINLTKSGIQSIGLTKNDLYAGNKCVERSSIAPGDHKLCEEDSRPIETYEGHVIPDMTSEINLSLKEHIIFLVIGVVVAMLVYLVSFLV